MWEAENKPRKCARCQGDEYKAEKQGREEGVLAKWGRMRGAMTPFQLVKANCFFPPGWVVVQC